MDSRLFPEKHCVPYVYRGVPIKTENYIEVTLHGLALYSVQPNFYLLCGGVALGMVVVKNVPECGACSAGWRP